MLTADAARSRCVRCSRCRKLGGVTAVKAKSAALAKVVAQRAAVVTAAAAVKAAKAAEAAERAAATANTFAIYEHQQRQAAAHQQRQTATIDAKVSETASLVKPNLVNKGGKTTLMFAAENANIDKVKELLTKGDTVNACSTNDKIACEKGQADGILLRQQVAAQGTAATTAGTLAKVVPKAKKRVAPTLIAASPLSAVSTAPMAATASALCQHQQQQALCINGMVLQAAQHGHSVVVGGGIDTNGGGKKKRAATNEPEHLEGSTEQKKARTSTMTDIPAT